MSNSIDKATLFRIVSFTLAGADVLQTMPATYRLYRKQWDNKSLSPVCFFYAMSRYMSIISLISNGIGALSTNFTLESCRRFYMLPNITALLAGIAVQALLFIRTYAISGRSKYVMFGLSALLMVCIPLEVFGIVYHRDMQLKGGACKGKVFHKGDPDWNVVFYSTQMGYDLIVCAVGTYFLWSSALVNGQFNASRFVRRVLRNGLLYTITVFLVNLWVVLEFSRVFVTGAASTLPLTVVMIAAQHLILSIQSPRGTDDSVTDRLRSGPNSRTISGGRHRETTQGVEMYKVTETHLHHDPPPHHTHQQKITFDAERQSVDIDKSGHFPH
ncbi:unnamed protein product [Mycena citricolor]|uniref:Uncharacterized protein n=1 Tax=Mycena citricolor TaxID=2018698 RepID=A0AAD2K3I2_9AGAR|nr:unnamed protein product [Mycena citricolor]CAK5275379.1 unnamed protein product [Mycena citricolor]